LLHRLCFYFSDGLFRPRHDKANRKKRRSLCSTSNRLRLQSSRNSNISSRLRPQGNSSNISSNKLRLQDSSRNNISNNKLRDNNSVSNSNKLRLQDSSRNNISSSKLRDNNSVSSRTTQRSSSSKPEGNKIANANSGNSRTTLQNKISSKLRGNTISNSSSSVNSKTIPLDSSRPEDSRIGNVNSRTTGPPSNEAHLKYINNRSLGRVIVLTVGSLSTVPGSNVAVTTATAFRMTGSVATMASLTSSASTVSP
jgi:hypothetical protein